MDRVRVGTVGTGSIFHGWGGGSGHLHAYRNVREAQVVALCDPDPVRLRRAEAALKAGYEEEAQQAEAAGGAERAADLRGDAKELKTYTSATEMFCSAGLDLADIISSPKTHGPLSVEALRAGVNVLCQKPMTRHWLECLPVIEAVEASGKLFGCMENMIYESPWYDTKKLVDSGVVGDPLLMFISFGVREAIPIRWDPEASGGGSLIDMGVHALVTAWFICGFERELAWAKATAPVGVAIRMPERLIRGKFEQVAVEDDAHVAFELADRATGARTLLHVEASWSGQDRPGCRLIGSHGELDMGSPVKVRDAMGNAYEVATQQPITGYAIAEGRDAAYSGFVGAVREMCRCVQDGTEPVYGVGRASDAMALLGAGYLSELRGGATVTLDEFKAHSIELQKREGDRAVSVSIGQMAEHLRRKAT